MEGYECKNDGCKSCSIEPGILHVSQEDIQTLRSLEKYLKKEGEE